VQTAIMRKQMRLLRTAR